MFIVVENKSIWMISQEDTDLIQIFERRAFQMHEIYQTFFSNILEEAILIDHLKLRWNPALRPLC